MVAAWEPKLGVLDSGTATGAFRACVSALEIWEPNSNSRALQERARKSTFALKHGEPMLKETDISRGKADLLDGLRLFDSHCRAVTHLLMKIFQIFLSKATLSRVRTCRESAISSSNVQRY